MNKDSNSNSKFNFKNDLDNSSNSKKTNTSSIQFKNGEDAASVSSARSRKNKQETNVIYKGMPYDEWQKIRDQFLKTHNMLQEKKKKLFNNFSHNEMMKCK